MHRNTWKSFERRVAALFGSKRNRCSGSSGRPELDPSDSDNPDIHIEAKHKSKCSVWTLYLKTRATEAKHASRNKREPRPVVLALGLKHHPGALLVMHEEDFRAIAGMMIPDES